MNARTIIDLETCQSNPKFETVALVAKELNILSLIHISGHLFKVGLGQLLPDGRVCTLTVVVLD